MKKVKESKKKVEVAAAGNPLIVGGTQSAVQGNLSLVGNNYQELIERAWNLLAVLDFPPMGTPFLDGIFSSEEGASYLKGIPQYAAVCEAFVRRLSHLEGLEPGAAEAESFKLDNVTFGLMSMVAMPDPWEFPSFNGLDMLRPAMKLAFLDPQSAGVKAVEKLMRFDVETLREGIGRLDDGRYPEKEEWIHALDSSLDGGLLRLVEGRAEFSSEIYFRAQHFMLRGEFLGAWLSRALNLEKVKDAMDKVGDHHRLNAWVADPHLGWTNLIMWLCDRRKLPLLGCARGWDSRFPSSPDLAGCRLVGKAA